MKSKKVSCPECGYTARLINASDDTYYMCIDEDCEMYGIPWPSNEWSEFFTELPQPKGSKK